MRVLRNNCSKTSLQMPYYNWNSYLINFFIMTLINQHKLLALSTSSDYLIIYEGSTRRKWNE